MTDPLGNILDKMTHSRGRSAVAKKIMELSLVADKKLLAKKRRRKSQKREDGFIASDSLSDSDHKVKHGDEGGWHESDDGESSGTDSDKENTSVTADGE